MAHGWKAYVMLTLLFVTTMSFKSKRALYTDKLQLPQPSESRLQMNDDMGALKTSEQNWVVIFFTVFAAIFTIFLLLKWVDMVSLPYFIALMKYIACFYVEFKRLINVTYGFSLFNYTHFMNLELTSSSYSNTYLNKISQCIPQLYQIYA